jgi:hypothetical protein
MSHYQSLPPPPPQVHIHVGSGAKLTLDNDLVCMNGIYVPRDDPNHRYSMFSDPRLLVLYCLTICATLLAIGADVLFDLHGNDKSFRINFTPWFFIYLGSNFSGFLHGFMVLTSFPKRSIFISKNRTLSDTLIPSKSNCNAILRIASPIISVVVNSIWFITLLPICIIALTKQNEVWKGLLVFLAVLAALCGAIVFSGITISVEINSFSQWTYYWFPTKAVNGNNGQYNRQNNSNLVQNNPNNPNNLNNFNQNPNDWNPNRNNHNNHNNHNIGPLTPLNPNNGHHSSSSSYNAMYQYNSIHNTSYPSESQSNFQNSQNLDQNKNNLNQNQMSQSQPYHLHPQPQPYQANNNMYYSAATTTTTTTTTTPLPQFNPSPSAPNYYVDQNNNHNNNSKQLDLPPAYGE